MCHWMWQWNAQKPGLSATKRRMTCVYAGMTSVSRL